MKRLTDEEKRLAESCFNLACGVARKQCKRDGTDRYLDDYMEAAWWCLVALAGNGRWNPLIGKFSTYCHKPLIRAVYKESQRLRQRQAVGEVDEAAVCREPVDLPTVDLRTLWPDERAVIEARYVRGATIEQAAWQLGESTAYVTAKERDALNELGRRLVRKQQHEMAV